MKFFYCILTRFLSSLARIAFFKSIGAWSWRRHLASLRNLLKKDETSDGIVWFHAASAGELEVLWSVARSLRSKREFQNFKMGLSVFSRSAQSRLAQFEKEFDCIYCGPSPLEGEWAIFFNQLLQDSGNRVVLFVSVKYEVWPELWGFLLGEKIPLLLVNAEWRRSLAWGSQITKYVFGGLPDLFLSCVSENEAFPLRAQIQGEVQVVGDPRWDQVLHRLSQDNKRVKELRNLAEALGLPRPWVIAGSFWDEDLAVLIQALQSRAFSGTFWIAPHRPSDNQESLWLKKLAPLAPKGVAISTRLETFHPIRGESLAFVLVQELGVLAELYALGDAAWVGGGFRSGLHSVIEPALSDLWIGAGGLRRGKFPEVQMLQDQRQLSLFGEEVAVLDWLSQISQKPPTSLVHSWRAWRSSSQLGSSIRVADWALEIARDRSSESVNIGTS